MRRSLRWWVLGAFALSGALNYLDRQVLAALAPLLRAEFHLSNADYGLVLAAFSVTYAASAPLAGLFLDRVGLNRGVSAAVGLWSLAGVATSMTKGSGGLTACRAWLGVAEAAGVPASGKAIVLYLKPQERALGHAISQIGLSAGAMIAPPLAVGLAARYGWRSAFLVTGLAGFLWIPFWNWIARKAPAAADQAPRDAWSLRQLLADRRLWLFPLATVLGMTVYTLWSNWTTLYLVQERGLKLEQTAWLAALPPVAANLGGVAGGWLSLRWMKNGTAAVAARMRVCLAAALIVLLTAAIPLAPGVLLAAAGICLSFFCVSAWSVNLYTMPLDIYGPGRAAFATSLLTGAYGAMQAVFSPVIGALVDRYGFAPVCTLVSVLPLAAWGVLRWGGVERTR